MNWLILFLGISTNAFASVLIKIAVSEPRKMPSLSEPISILLNWPFWLGLTLYGFAFILYTVALSKFPLHIAHPILTTGAVAMVALLSAFLFNEQLHWNTITGILFIIIGVIMISLKTNG